jgi:hypothetical protein
MKGIISKTLAAVCLGGGIAAAGGCCEYYELVDSCYPQRYECAARHEVQAAFGPQVCNGHVLDQTIWNCHFEPGSDRLTPGGMDHLSYLARRRPSPDTKIYVQTAQDVPYDPAVPNQFAEARNELDRKRVDAIHKYLAAETENRPLSFEVVVHDSAEVGISTVPANIAIQQMYTGTRGNLPITAGVSASGGGGPVSGGGGGGRY